MRWRRCAPLTRASAVMCAAEQPFAKLKRLERELDMAIREERYGVAASLRDELSMLKMDGELGVLSANADFYRFFSEHDMDGMENLWLDVPEAACIHPGHPPLQGYDIIIESWRKIFEGDAFEIEAENVRCRVSGGIAYVTCLEKIGNNRLAATNVFEESEGSWKLVVHQAGPCMVEVADTSSKT